MVVKFLSHAKEVLGVLPVMLLQAPEGEIGAMPEYAIGAF